MKVNVENGVAAIALAWLNGVTPEEIKHGMATFAGPRRRFDFHLKKENIVLIDDYAHHPAELKAIFDAVTIADKRLIHKEELLDVVAAEAGKLEVVLMVGAGNIELLVDPVKQILDKKE